MPHNILSCRLSGLTNQPLKKMRSGVKYILDGVSRQYTKHPVLAVWIATTPMFGLSDLISQHIERIDHRHQEMLQSKKLKQKPAQRTGLSDSNRMLGLEQGTNSPSITQAGGSSGSGSAVGGFAQNDWRRTIAVAACAPIFNGGICLLFYRFIDNLFGTAANLRTAFIKMMVCQFSYTPFSACLFLFISKFFHRGLCGDSWEDMLEAARENSRGKLKKHFQIIFKN